MKYFFASVLIIYAASSGYLRELEIDYYLALLLILISTTHFLFFSKTRLQKIDTGWFLVFIFAAIYSAYAFINKNPILVIAAQSLMFFMPLISLSSRSLKIQFSRMMIENWLCIFVIAKLFYMAINYNLVLESLQNSGDRARYHDYTSISLALSIFSAFIFGLIKRRSSQALLAASAIIFSIMAAHRSLYVAFFVQSIIFIFSKNISELPSKWVTRNLLIVLAFGLALTLTDAGSIIIELFGDSIRGTDGNTNFRIYLSWLIIKNSLYDFFGNGFGQSFKYLIPIKDDSIFYAAQHNSVLTLLYFLGWIPMVAFIYFSKKLISKTISAGEISGFYGNTLIGMLTFSLFNMFLEHPIYGVTFWIIYGFFIIAIRNERQTRQ